MVKSLLRILGVRKDNILVDEKFTSFFPQSPSRKGRKGGGSKNKHKNNTTTATTRQEEHRRTRNKASELLFERIKLPAQALLLPSINNKCAQNESTAEEHCIIRLLKPFYCVVGTYCMHAHFGGGSANRWVDG